MDLKNPEKYARNVALTVAKQDWPHVIVKESPKNRYYAELTRKYDARWILDLHSNDAFRHQRKNTEFLSMISCGSRGYNEWPESFYMISKWKNHPSRKYPIDVDSAFEKPLNVIAVELFHQNSYSRSIKFLKELTKHLYLNPL